MCPYRSCTRFDLQRGNQIFGVSRGLGRVRLSYFRGFDQFGGHRFCGESIACADITIFLHHETPPVGDLGPVLDAVDELEHPRGAKGVLSGAHQLDLFEQRGVVRIVEHPPVRGVPQPESTAPRLERPARSARIECRQAIQRRSLPSNQRVEDDLGESSYVVVGRNTARVGDGQVCRHPRDQTPRIVEHGSRFAKRQRSDDQCGFGVRLGAAHVRPQPRRYTRVLTLNDFTGWLEERGGHVCRASCLAADRLPDHRCRKRNVRGRRPDVIGDSDDCRPPVRGGDFEACKFTI